MQVIKTLFLVTLLVPNLTFAAYTVETSTGTEANNGIGYDLATQIYAAQTFDTVGAGVLTQVEALIAYTGSQGTDLISASLWQTNGTTPNVSVATSTGVTASTLAANCSGARTTFTFVTPPSVNASTKYGIVFSTNGVVGTGNAAYTCASSANPYAGGLAYVKGNGGAWSGNSAVDNNMLITIGDAASAGPVDFGFFLIHWW